MALNLTKLLCRRNIFNNSSQSILQSAFNKKLLINNGIRTVAIKIVKPSPEIKEGYDKKNERLQRTQSPHLTIYKAQLQTLLSISHRITGIGVTFYGIVFAWGSLLSAHDFSYYLETIQSLNLTTTTVIIIKLIIGFPYFYHFVCGIRHLIMDLGYCYKMKEAYKLGYATIASTIALTVFFSIY